MNCLCCGKTMPEPLSVQERKYQWHDACVRHFFHTKTMPEIVLSDEILEMLAAQAVQEGLTVPGVQKKLSLHLSKEKDVRLTIHNHPGGYILKPQTNLYVHLPEAENLVMRMAEAIGIFTVPHALVRTDPSGEYGYITRRIDRDRDMNLYAMEDFCQLDGRLTQDKYRGSYERCAALIQKYSSRPGLDLSELFLRLVYCFVTGNSDMHLKNFSLIETAPCSREYVLSAAYDLLPVNIILPEDKDQTALTLNGKKRGIRRKDFLVFAKSCRLSEKTADRLIEKVLSCEQHFYELCEDSYLPEKMKGSLKTLIAERLQILRGGREYSPEKIISRTAYRHPS